MLEYPHSSVVRALKRFNPLLTIDRNEKWVPGMDPYERWWVSQYITAMHPTVLDGVVVVCKSKWQVLGVDQASWIDRRWFEVLDAHRWKNCPDLKQKWRDEQIRLKQDCANETRDWFKDQGYWYWKKQYGGFRFPNVKKVDPTYARKKREDELGKIPI